MPKDRYDAAWPIAPADPAPAPGAGRVSATYSDLLRRAAGAHPVHRRPDPGEHAEPDLTRWRRAGRGRAHLAGRFEEALRLRGGGQVAALRRRYGSAFPVSYQDQFDVAEALADMDVIETLDSDRPTQARIDRAAADGPDGLRLKLDRLDQAALLSDLLPIVEAMGLKGWPNMGSRSRRRARRACGCTSCSCATYPDTRLTSRRSRRRLNRRWSRCGAGAPRTTASTAWCWAGRVLGQVALIGTLARYRRQSGLDPSRAVQEAALSDDPAVARLILDLFGPVSIRGSPCPA